MARFILIFFLCCPLAETGFAQASFTINLKVEGADHYTAWQHEPITFSTHLLNNNLRLNVQWNKAADEWLAQLSADHEAGKISTQYFNEETTLALNGKRPVQVITIGTAGSPWYKQLKFEVIQGNSRLRTNWSIALLGEVLSGPVAVLNEEGYYVVKHHLAPERMGKLRPGNYKVVAILNGVRSNAVTIIIRNKHMPLQVLNTRQMQLRLGNYYLQRKEGLKARLFALWILKRNRNDINGLVLRGESYILTMKNKLALADFENALRLHLKEFPGPEEEPPEYLGDRIAWLKTKIMESAK